MCFAMSNVFCDDKCVLRRQMCFAMFKCELTFKMRFVNVKMLSRKQVNVFENREMRFGFLVLCLHLWATVVNSRVEL